LPPVVDEETPRKTTITGTERAAFQKLYRKFDAEGRQQKKKDHAVELDQIADEYYEDDEDQSKPSLDKVFDEVLRGEPRLRASRTVPQRLRTRESAADADAETGKVPNSKRRGNHVDTARFKETCRAERERVDNLIRNALTDRALWQTLEREVFTKVRALDLDNVSSGASEAPSSKTSSAPLKKSSKAKSVHKPDPPSTDARILFENYPHHLITAISTLRTEFPSSPLPFAILPTIKKLGRSSHALGATTTLYKHLIRTAWIQQSSYTTINMLLTEMDHNAIEFDADILGLLDAMIKEHNQAKSGVLGRGMGLVYGMDMFLDGLAKITTWRNVVAERLGMRSEEKRAASTIVRKTTRVEPKTWRGVGAHKKDGHTQRSGVRSDSSVSEHVPLVEGVNPGVGGLHGETAPEEVGGHADSLGEGGVAGDEATAEHSQEGHDHVDSTRAKVLV
jgi:hypothetical protein